MATEAETWAIGVRERDRTIRELEAENKALKDQLAELNGAISWDTSCLSCASVLDASYAATVRAEKAEAELARSDKFKEKWRNQAEMATALVEQLREELALYKRDNRHQIELRDDGWTIQHPMTCRPNLFDCIANTAAVMPEAGQLPNGRYYCTVDQGQVIIGEQVG